MGSERETRRGFKLRDCIIKDVGGEAGDDADAILDAVRAAIQSDPMLLTELGCEQQRDLWVHMGERHYVEGIPFGGYQEHAEGYHSPSKLREGDEPVFRVVRDGQ